MPRLTLLLVALGLLAAAVVPAGAGAVILRLPDQYRATASGTSTVTWTRRTGPVGTACAQWFSQDGKVTSAFRTPKGGFTVAIGDDVPGFVRLTGKLRGSATSIQAWVNEPGCPACSAGAARLTPDGGPFARIADCGTVEPRVTTRTPCTDAKPMLLLALAGDPVVRAQYTADENPRRRKRLCTEPPGGLDDPAVFRADELRSLKRGTLVVTRNASGRCPDAGLEDGGATTVTCRWKLRLKLSFRRL